MPTDEQEQAMHAIRQHELGGPEVLRHEEVADLEPGTGQVRIAVEVSGVHLLDTTIRSGAAAASFGPPELPMTPGREVAGRVDAVGDGVDAAWLDAAVVAHLGMVSGGYAEQAVVDVDRLHAVPDGLALDVAVAAIGTGRTATGVLDLAPIGPDDVVIVTAASGGLGSLLVLEACRVGATVVGLAGGPRKVAHVLDLGADHAVDYRRDDWDDVVRGLLGASGATLVYDGVGGDTAARAFGLLAPHGTLVQYSGETLEAGDDGRTVLPVLGPAMMARPGGLRSLEEEALARAADGSRVPVVGTTFTLRDAASAHRALEARTTVGKVVLRSPRS